MSLTGKGALSLRKKDVQEQKSIAVGFKKTQFAHKATAGETGIDLTSLTLPTEMSSLGFTNPNTADIVGANLFFYRKNFTLISSSKGELIQNLSYTIASSSRLNFEGFTADEDEIFVGIIDLNPSTTLNVVDAQPLVVTGTLAANSTDINTGKAFEAGKFPTEQMGAVSLYIDGVLQARNTGNQPSPQDGNYYEVPAGTTSSLLRMNSSDTSDRAYMVISNGLLVEKPSQSQLQEVEKVQGQIDAMVPTLAAVAGVPTTDFQAAPNNQDLKQFGDRLLQAEADIDELQDESPPETPYQVKFLIADKTSTVGLTDLTFNNLEIGKHYKVSLQSFFRSTDNQQSTMRITTEHDSIVVMESEFKNSGAAVGGDFSSHVKFGNSVVFEATSTTLLFNFVRAGTNGRVMGNGTKTETWAQLEELPNHIETSKWT